MSIVNPTWWHALNLCLDEFSPKMANLAQGLGGPEAVFRLPESRLLAAGLPPGQARRLAARRSQIDPRQEWDRLNRLGIRAVCLGQADYPSRLAQIHSPPPLIYIRGDLSVLANDCLAVVGSRKLTPYGRQAIQALVPPLASLGVTVVSGMALGADGAGLEACLEHGGRPVAVLASSLDYSEITPRSHWLLAKRIESAGCLVSENPPGRPAHKSLFPLRNRIVSGLSQGVLVIEGALVSGSMITARLALEQNRSVLAVPGPIFSAQSRGTLDLIKRGAKCVTGPEDIASELGWDLAAKPTVSRELSPTQAAIMRLLADSPAPAGDLIASTGLDAAAVLAALTEMEILGMISASGQGVYAKIR